MTQEPQDTSNQTAEGTTPNKGRVLVTGASGYIAGFVILRLLEAGYSVRGTVRNAAKGEAVKAVLAAQDPRAKDIEIVEADLASDKGWAEAVSGVQCVQHVASPFPTVQPKNADDLINPARDGALRVLKAAKAADVARVVMTSSLAAIVYTPDRPAVSDETVWSDPNNLKGNTAYTRSKTIAEKAAWDYVEGDGAGLELAVVNPGAVLGPVLSDDVSTSLELVRQLLAGEVPAAPKVGFALVDVRDVADMHVAAMERPEAAGERFVCATDFLWMGDIAKVLKEGLSPTESRKVPTGDLPNFAVKLFALMRPELKQLLPELGNARPVSNAKAKRLLGWAPRTPQEAILDCARSLIAHEIVTV